MTAINRNPASIDTRAGHERAAPREVRVKNPTAKQTTKSKEHGSNELQQRGLASFVCAVENLHAGLECIDGDIG